MGFFPNSTRKEVAKRARMAAQSLGSASEDGVLSLTEFRWRKLEESYEQSHRIHGAGIFTCIYHQNQPNAGKYSIHGSLGNEWLG